MKQHLTQLTQWCLTIYFLFGMGGAVVVAQAEMSVIVSSAAGLDKDYLYFDLVCNVGPFSGYFHPKRWERTDDHAFQISKVIEGEDNSVPATEMTGIVFSGPRSLPESWSIEVPTSGYLSFRINPAPKGKDLPDFIQINNANTNYQVRSDGLYYSPFLQKGDRFTLRIPPGRELFHWSELVFHTNFSAVIVKPKAPSIAQRYVPIETGKIQRVFFPTGDPGVWPVFDKDGDRSTTFDQIELRASTDIFDVEYIDNQVLKNGEYVLQRTFTIKEKCRRANRMKRQRDWSQLPLIVTTEWRK